MKQKECCNAALLIFSRKNCNADMGIPFANALLQHISGDLTKVTLTFCLRNRIMDKVI